MFGVVVAATDREAGVKEMAKGVEEDREMGEKEDDTGRCRDDRLRTCRARDERLARRVREKTELDMRSINGERRRSLGVGRRGRGAETTASRVEW